MERALTYLPVEGCCMFRRTGMVGWCEFAVMNTKALERIFVPRRLPLTAALGVLGGTGMTGYFGMTEIGRPKRGDVVVVSAAAGATGSVAAQLAKHVMGCFVVGIAGGPAKCAHLTDTLRLDAAVDYKAAGGVNAGLREALGGRTIDVYFDSVGGETLEAALRRLSQGARVVLCGAIGAYNTNGTGGAAVGPRNYMQLLVCRARMEGFLVFDYATRYDVARRRLGDWVANGQLVCAEQVSDGLSTAPEALLGLFEGKNLGKAVVRVAYSQYGHDEPGTDGARHSRL